MNDERKAALVDWYTALYNEAIKDSCERCELSFSHRVIEAVDRDARFWLGDKAPRYCVPCADILSEQQWVIS
jgi:hypothetical protein